MRKDFVRMTVQPEDEIGRASVKVAVLRQFFEGGEAEISLPASARIRTNSISATRSPSTRRKARNGTT